MADNTDDTDPTARQASREASGWMIRLQEAPDDADLRRRFDDWLSDPAHAAAWEETQRMTRAVARATPRHATTWGPYLKWMREEDDKAPKNPAPERRPSRARRDPTRRTETGRDRAPANRTRRRVLKLAGLAVAASVLALVAGPELALHLRADYMTAKSETRTVRLEDDSLVAVAPDSAVAVSFDVDERRVRLLAGEVYLDVRADADRPFRVEADGIVVTVVGTAFNVSETDSSVEVGVAHGTVRVTKDTAPLLAASALAAGEFVRISPSGRIQRGKQPASQIGAWRQEQLIAQDQPLGDVLARLRRYHAGTILLMDGSLADQPVTGVYDLSDPVAALRAIARSQDAVVHAFTPWLLVVSRS